MSDLIMECPSTDMDRKDRINIIIHKEFDKWAKSQEIKDLFKLFLPKETFLANLDIEKYLDWLRGKISPIWDFRQMQKQAMTETGEPARWLLKNNEFVEQNEGMILSACKELGLMKERESFFNEVDYILPLGWARLSNLRRPQLARKMAELLFPKQGIVALSALRPLEQSEMEGFIDFFAPEAETEFDALAKGMEIAFDLPDDFQDTEINSNNINFCSVIRKFNKSFLDTDLYAVAAPSSNASRRANSVDCFEFFFHNFNVKPGAKILNCTSQIYCTYQHVRAFHYAIKYCVNMDTVGYPAILNIPNGKYTEQNYQKAVNFLQEIKGTLDAMCDFVNEYKKM